MSPASIMVSISSFGTSFSISSNKNWFSLFLRLNITPPLSDSIGNLNRLEEK
jgi:hypothetical protein